MHTSASPLLLAIVWFRVRRKALETRVREEWRGGHVMIWGLKGGNPFQPPDRLVLVNPNHFSPNLKRFDFYQVLIFRTQTDLQSATNCWVMVFFYHLYIGLSHCCEYSLWILIILILYEIEVLLQKSFVLLWTCILTFLEKCHFYLWN